MDLLNIHIVTLCPEPCPAEADTKYKKAMEFKINATTQPLASCHLSLSFQ